jgi:two-component sensor histidine kinase
MLAIVQATVNLSQSDTPEGLKHAINGRIQALATVHSLFVESRWIGAELFSIVSQELAPYLREGATRVRVDGPRVLLPPDVAQAVAMITHELATNAAKYGSLSVPTGQVEVTWSLAVNGQLALHWTESGGPPIKKPEHKGFGTSVMEGMIRGQSNGEMHLDWRAEGLACKIVLQTIA